MDDVVIGIEWGGCNRGAGVVVIGELPGEEVSRPVRHFDPI